MNRVSQDAEIGRRTSGELTEVRTVLSRAEAALDRLVYIEQRHADQDPEHNRIHDDLIHVVARLERYRRTGRPRGKR